MQFSHLHTHTQFSLLDGASSIEKLYAKAIKDNMPSIAITDHGNMFGVFKFVAEAHKNSIILPDGTKQPKVKPIVGCEFYLVEERGQHTFTKQKKDKRYHQLLIAKNSAGYQNLIKLCSLGYIEGLYSKYPRIDKELILKYHKNLIATTCCLGAKVPRMILDVGEEEAEKEFLWWLNIFQDDYYIELQRHDLEDQDRVNDILLKWSKKYSVKCFASNDVHYVDQEDSTLHDILLCINTGEKLSTPKKSDYANPDIVNEKNKRFAFPNDNFFFKTTEQMADKFRDIPEAIDNTNEIISKVDILNLERDILLPNFDIPKTYTSQFDYLKHLALEGAKARYFELTDRVMNRIHYELEIIDNMGFPGYFLIVQDFILAAKKMNVLVGPGRGSAAGSIVAYCLGITNLDPLKYDLLFERFLNPDRKSLPDIDVDFDDEGRDKVINYIVNKYGQNQVAQIVSYGNLRSKNSIRDVARVMDLSLQESAILTNLVPQKQTLNITLNRLLHANLDGKDSLKEKEDLTNEELQNVKTLRKYYADKNSLHSSVLSNAAKLEGSVRNTGIHAAGLIIAPENLMNIVPLCTSKEANMNVTQISGDDIEKAGAIKMDVLSIKTLTLVKNAQDLIRKHSDPNFNIDNIPLDDEETFKLFQVGNTTGVFQFESPGMRTHLRDLKPDRFEDLIAMNALYRPGPMSYIGSYIKRKHGKEQVTYVLDDMEDVLKETYGITVYQEQVMLLAQKIAGFSRGDSDFLRKAMGKKDRKTLEKMKTNFVKGASSKGYEKKIIDKIWSDWEAFASYAFNKSHSTVYALIAYQTAYLKKHFPHEFYTATLNTNNDRIEKITIFTTEAKTNKLEILAPDINESEVGFSLNSKKQIRFGLDAIKGLGSNFCDSVIKERKEKGAFQNLLDLFTRVERKTINKKNLESLVYAGALDCFTEFHRAQYFHLQQENNTLSGIDSILRIFSRMMQKKEDNMQQSLFLDSPASKQENLIKRVVIDDCEEWSLLEKLKYEKEVTGIYISGHPLDNYAFEFKYLGINSTEQVKEFIAQSNEANKRSPDGKFRIAGLLSKVQHRDSQKGTKYAKFILEDYTGVIELGLYKESYTEFSKFVQEEHFLVIELNAFKYPNRQDYTLKISKIFLLENMRDMFCNNIAMTLLPEEMDKDFASKVKDILNKPAGKTQLHISLFDKQNNQTIHLTHKTKKIKIDDEFAHYLADQTNILVRVD